jgi:hypothetical protein
MMTEGYKMTKDTMPMDAVELMVSIDFKNRCATDRMIYKMDLREIAERKASIVSLEGAAGLLKRYCDKQNELGISPIWVDDALYVIEKFIEVERYRFDREEADIEARLETLNRQVKEFEQKEKKRKKNGKRTAKKNAKKT